MWKLENAAMSRLNSPSVSTFLREFNLLYMRFPLNHSVLEETLHFFKTTNKTSHLQIEQSDLALGNSRVHHGPGLPARVDHDSHCGSIRDHSIRPEHVLHVQRAVLDLVVGCQLQNWIHFQK